MLIAYEYLHEKTNDDDATVNDDTSENNYNIDDIGVAVEYIPEKNDDDANINDDANENNGNEIIDDIGVANE